MGNLNFLSTTISAAVVMYNYFRWFPEGEIVFAAPSRPLVMQQIEACHNIVGIPQEWTIEMTGVTSPSKRASLWKSKRVFFLTPQVLEKDIQSDGKKSGPKAHALKAAKVVKLGASTLMTRLPRL